VSNNPPLTEEIKKKELTLAQQEAIQAHLKREESAKFFETLTEEQLIDMFTTINRDKQNGIPNAVSREEGLIQFCLQKSKSLQ
jgi:Mg/Co/Ni transporter MgtE